MNYLRRPLRLPNETIARQEALAIGGENAWLGLLRRRFQLSLVLFLCCLATGTQWEVLQVFAWGRMMVNYSRSEPLAQAVSDTFDGQMCSICRLVAGARKQQQAHPEQQAPQAETKIMLFYQSVPTVVVAAPRVIGHVVAGQWALTRDRAMPPVPPPRVEAA
jgi:hypothetical protein